MTRWLAALRAGALSAICLSGVVPAGGPAYAFPPYRSTDADTADPWTLEVRAGLIEIEREDDRNTYITPLVGLNFGLPDHFEVTTELEYVPDDGEVADAAIGVKWAPVQGLVSLGVETLALLPVADNTSGVGFEGQLLATLDAEPVLVHVNGGGFYDPRPAATEDGWRASGLVELPLDGVRPGIELFATQTSGEDVDVRAGTGAIADLGLFDVRAGIHAGLTDPAPDLTFSLWLAFEIPVR